MSETSKWNRQRETLLNVLVRATRVKNTDLPSVECADAVSHGLMDLIEALEGLKKDCTKLSLISESDPAAAVDDILEDIDGKIEHILYHIKDMRIFSIQIERQL